MISKAKKLKKTILEVFRGTDSISLLNYFFVCFQKTIDLKINAIVFSAIVFAKIK